MNARSNSGRQDANSGGKEETMSDRLVKQISRLHVMERERILQELQDVIEHFHSENEYLKRQMDEFIRSIRFPTKREKQNLQLKTRFVSILNGVAPEDAQECFDALRDAILAAEIKFGLSN